MKKKKPRFSMTIYLDEERGILTDEDDFSNIMKYDSPSVIKALKRKLNNGK